MVTLNPFIADSEISDGKVQVDIKYNDKELYTSKRDLCSADKNSKNRIIFCPIRPGFHRFVKLIKVPGFIPKVSVQIWHEAN